MSVNIVTLGPGTLTFGEDTSLINWSSQVTKCSVVPDVKTDDPTKVLSGESAPGERTEAFTLQGTFLQDLGADNSVSEFTWDHRGEEMPFEFIPSNAKGRKVTGTCVIEATELGGEVGPNATAEFEFRCTDAPEVGNIVTGPGGEG